MEPPTGDSGTGGGAEGAGDPIEPLDPDDDFVLHPNVPRRGPLLLAFAAVTICGALGTLIGYGLIDTSCQEEPSLIERMLEQVRGYHAASRNCGVAKAGGSIVGAVIAAVGASVVAVLMLRAMAEWRVHRPTD